jgi:hypothetical protein
MASVLHGSARTTPHLRAELQACVGVPRLLCRQAKTARPCRQKLSATIAAVSWA